MIIEYELEYLDGDEYISTILECGVAIVDAERDVGIMSEQAEIFSVKDTNGNDFYQRLTDFDKEQIRLAAINSYVNDRSYKWCGRL